MSKKLVWSREEGKFVALDNLVVPTKSTSNTGYNTRSNTRLTDSRTDGKRDEKKDEKRDEKKDKRREKLTNDSDTKESQNDAAFSVIDQGLEPDDLDNLIDNLRAEELRQATEITQQQEDEEMTVSDLIDSLRAKELSHVLNSGDSKMSHVKSNNQSKDKEMSNRHGQIRNEKRERDEKPIYDNRSRFENEFSDGFDDIPNIPDGFFDVFSDTPGTILSKQASQPPKQKIQIQILPQKTNRIDARTERQFIKRSYHDQYLLERAWYLLGQKVLTEEIVINPDLLENPNILVPRRLPPTLEVSPTTESNCDSSSGATSSNHSSDCSSPSNMLKSELDPIVLKVQNLDLVESRAASVSPVFDSLEDDKKEGETTLQGTELLEQPEQSEPEQPEPEKPEPQKPEPEKPEPENPEEVLKTEEAQKGDVQKVEEEQKGEEEGKSEELMQDDTDVSEPLNQNVTIYKLNDNSYIFPMSKEGIPGSFWGAGQNEDFSRPIEAIELFRLPHWSENEYSYKLVFSRETFLLSTLMTEDGPRVLEEIIPCGVEVLAADLFRVQL